MKLQKTQKGPILELSENQSLPWGDFGIEVNHNLNSKLVWKPKLNQTFQKKIELWFQVGRGSERLKP
jgi:hypothetical protein